MEELLQLPNLSRTNVRVKNARLEVSWGEVHLQFESGVLGEPWPSPFCYCNENSDSKQLQEERVYVAYRL